MRSIGVFCGTFNPIHLGHLLVAECARDQFNLEKVIFVTSPRPPHRNDVLLDARQRHEMVALAVADNPHFEASTLEIERSGPSYTIDTIKQLIDAYGVQVQFNLLLGADNIKHLASWHQPEELALLVRFLVAPRSGEPSELNHSKRTASSSGSFVLSHFAIPMVARCEVIDFPAVDISSSEIRKRISQGRSVLYMVPPVINQVLIERGFYRGARV